jgi:glycosyltransferase involved in cell wall biosynthesis
LITIVTVVYNGEIFLEETIRSIISQDYANKEYIIIDGGSTDSSIEIIKKYDNQIDYWISEKDRGIGDAFNKAVILSAGSYINFQGDGDGLFRENVLTETMIGINPLNDLLISGKILRIDKAGNPIYISKQPKFFFKTSLLFRMSLPHQGLFMNIIFFKKYGLFDIDNKFSMDYELLLRAFHNFPNIVFKDLIVAKWRADGLGNNREIEIFDEYNFIKRKNNVSNLFFLKMIHIWILFKFKIKQIIFIK